MSKNRISALLLLLVASLAGAEEIQDFTTLAAAPASGDLWIVVDVSDTTDDAAGTAKIITTTNLFAYTGTFGGNATTATALAANPADCSAGQYATTIAASGALTCAQVNYSELTGTVPNAPTVTFADAASDTTTFVALGTAATGSLAPATDAGFAYNASTDTASFPIHNGVAGSVLVVNLPEQTATVGASQAGEGITITADDAVASTDTAGAAAGGDVTLTTGDAKRLTSGNANGGAVRLATGAGIGTGVAGKVVGYAAATGTGVTGFAIAVTGNQAITFTASDGSTAANLLANGLIDTAGTPKFRLTSTEGWGVASDRQYEFASTTSANGTNDTGLARDAAAEIRVSDGSTGIGSIRSKTIVEANTGTKAFTQVESGECYTNTGDADGSAITLLNDPAVGTTICVAVTAAQTITISPSADELLYMGTDNCAASMTANAVGATVTIRAMTGGSGAIWTSFGASGWTCND